MHPFLETPAGLLSLDKVPPVQGSVAKLHLPEPVSQVFHEPSSILVTVGQFFLTVAFLHAVLNTPEVDRTIPAFDSPMIQDTRSEQPLLLDVSILEAAFTLILKVSKTTLVCGSILVTDICLQTLSMDEVALQNIPIDVVD